MNYFANPYQGYGSPYGYPSAAPQGAAGALQAFGGQVTRVNGRNGADAFRMAPNSSILLMDENDPIVWLKQTDGAGYATVTPYTVTPYQAAALAESMGLSWDHITPWCWWIAMNMMYSDYGSVAIHYGVSTAEFFAELAQAFLFDKDGPGPKAKLAAYYHGIVKAKE